MVMKPDSSSIYTRNDWIGSTGQGARVAQWYSRTPISLSKSYKVLNTALLTERAQTARTPTREPMVDLRSRNILHARVLNSKGAQGSPTE